MNRTGRFDFWRVLLYSRAITPPRHKPDAIPSRATQWRQAWWLLVPAALTIAVVVTRQVARVTKAPETAVVPAPPMPPAARSRSW